MALLSVAEALAMAVAGIEPFGTKGDQRAAEIEDIPLPAALGRVPSGVHTASHSQPPFPSSAMDGYAVRGEDVRALPARLKVIGQSAAGHLFDGCIGSGETVRIFTGARVPDGADAIVIQENTKPEGSDVLVLDGRPDPAHIRPQGYDFIAGSPLHRSNAPLTARAITLLAAAGQDRVQARRRPRIAILSTGDELVAPGGRLGPGQIFASNHLGLAAMVRQFGAEPHLLGIARDTPASLKELLARGAAADILVTIGGASVGDHDLVGPALQEIGVGLDFWRIAMRPGKPLMFGRKGPQRVLGLPGNPVSALVCARVFLVPMIEAYLGIRQAEDGTIRTPLAVDLEANGPRQHYMRARRMASADGQTVEPCADQDSSLLSVLALDADCLIVRPAGAPAQSAGTSVPILPLDF